MSNASIINGTYDIGGLFAIDPISNGPSWLGAVNTELGGWFMLSVLVVVGLILFLAARKLDGVSDTRALVYAGFISSFSGMLLVIVSLTTENNLLGWEQWSVVFILTLIAIGLDKANVTY